MQSQKLSEVVVSPCKELQKDSVLLSNGVNKGQIEINQVNDAGFAEDTTIENSLHPPFHV